MRRDARAHVRGDVGGEVVVEPGGQIQVDGEIGGSMRVHGGAAAYVAGEIGGDVTVEGALMLVGGAVGGNVWVRPGGEFADIGV